MTTPRQRFFLGFAVLLSVGACQGKSKPAQSADAALPLGTGGGAGASEAGADQSPLDSTPDSIVSAGVFVGPTSADFGNVVQGASSTTPTFFAVTSTGLAISLNPAVTGPFVMVGNTCDTLPAGGDCTIGLTFNPVLVGPASGTLTVAAGVTASLAGTGVATPASLAFSPATTTVDGLLGEASAMLGFGLTNSGGSATGALTLISGGNVNQFAIDNRCSGPLAPLASCQINVVFNPTTAGAMTLTLTITDTSALTISAVATVKGNARHGDPWYFGGDGDFGTVVVGETSLAHDFTLTCVGQRDTSVLSVAVTDAHFVVTSDGCSNLPLAAGKSCTVSLVFKPGAAGAVGATLSISAPGWPSVTLPMKGIGVAAPAPG